MKYIIIGLGKYGRVLAEELSALGHEVIGVDNNENNINEVKDLIAVTYLLDASQEMSLSILPLKTVDVIIIAIGEALDASIRVLSLLKKKEVKHIYARAIDSTHREILEAFNVDKILSPEEDSAMSLVRQIDFNHIVDSMQIESDHYIMKFEIPEKFVGLYISDLKLDKSFNIKVLSLLSTSYEKSKSDLMVKTHKMVSEDMLHKTRLSNGDKLVCIGKQSDFRDLWKAI